MYDRNLRLSFRGQYGSYRTHLSRTDVNWKQLASWKMSTSTRIIEPPVWFSDSRVWKTGIIFLFFASCGHPAPVCLSLCQQCFSHLIRRVVWLNITILTTSRRRFWLCISVSECVAWDRERKIKIKAGGKSERKSVTLGYVEGSAMSDVI